MNDEDRELHPELQKRKAQMAAFLESQHKERIELLARPVALPDFMWQQLDRIAVELSMSTDQLIRIWLFLKLKETDR